MNLGVLGVLAAPLCLSACAHTPAAPRHRGDAVEIALYRDAAVVVERRRVEVGAGRSEVAFRVGRTVDAATPRLDGVRVVEARHRLGGPVAEDVLRGWIGREVDAGGVHGVLRAVDADELVIEGERLSVVKRPVEVTGPAGAGGAELRWVVEARQAGPHQVAAEYVMGGLAWSAGYTLVLEGARRSAWLEGWLAVDNRTGADVAASRAVLIDRPFARAAPAGPAPPPEAPDARRIALRAPLIVPRDRRVERPLLAGGGLRVPASLTAVFDPIGTALDQPRREPVADAAYGAAPPGAARAPLATYVEVDRHADPQPRAPPPPTFVGPPPPRRRAARRRAPTRRLHRARAPRRRPGAARPRARLRAPGGADHIRLVIPADRFR